MRNPDFLRFLSSHVANELGAHVSRVALPLVAVLALHATPLEVGLLSSLQTAAFLVIGLPAGVWVDRLRRRPILMSTDLVRFVLLAAIPVAQTFGVLSMPMLFFVAMAVGTAQVFNDVADQSYLPVLIPKEGLGDGNARLELVRSGGGLLGPGIGGLLVQLVGAPFTMLATSVSALASVLALSRIRAQEPEPPVVARRSLRTEMAEGLLFVWRDHVQRMIVASTFMHNLCISAVLGLSVLFLSTVVDLPPGAVGALLMSSAAGGVLGGLITGPLFRRFGAARVTWLSTTLTAPFGLLLPMTQSDWRASFFAITSIGLSAGAILFNVGQITYRQTVTPPQLLGRVNATVRFISWGVMPLGALLGGAVAQQIGVREALWVFMAGRLLSFVPLLFSPLPRMRDFEPTTQARS
ncbi:MFS transporter [Nonomuraea sp. NPDC050556]|uniref:MFS transporter n=1 Tax=Nonomuraea sp. NPDC050556 TaxID=3364369 RepID=UPI0037974965